MIDAIDRKIILLLQENARISNAALGKEVGLTISAVFERVKKLEKKGVIKSYITLVDAEALGKPIIALIRLKISSIKTNFRAAKKSIIDICLEEPDVLECYALAGEYDYIIKIRVATSTDLEVLIERIRDKTEVDSTVTNMILSTVKEYSIVYPNEPN